MKPMKKILLLGLTVAAIVVFWLMPGINKARHVNYVRKYEDTDRKTFVALSDTTKPLVIYLPKTSAQEKSAKKIYKTETIEADVKFSEIKPKMFSRAIQYEEGMERLMVVEIDSMNTIEVYDSVQYASADTLGIR
jgi:hypothetical protein